MPKLAYQGGEINYEVAGEGHPLIFVSGLNGVARYWQAQVPVFAKRYKVVTYDQRGTGGSDKATGTTALAVGDPLFQRLRRAMRRQGTRLM